MSKKCLLCKYYKQKIGSWGNCTEFGNKEVHEECCCQFWYPDVEKIRKYDAYKGDEIVCQHKVSGMF